MVDRVISVLGVIDLDPCSSPPPYTVPATLHISRAENGLTQRWMGKIFMNPPYGRELPAWADKLAHEVREKRVKEAITLTPASTDAAWFDLLWGADALCFVSGRLYFIGGDGRAPFASVVGYFGRRRKRFTEVFGEVGKIVYPKVV
jgi:hypothetical protein